MHVKPTSSGPGLQLSQLSSGLWLFAWLALLPGIFPSDTHMLSCSHSFFGSFLECCLLSKAQPDNVFKTVSPLHLPSFPQSLSHHGLSTLPGCFRAVTLAQDGTHRRPTPRQLFPDPLQQGGAAFVAGILWVAGCIPQPSVLHGDGEGQLQGSPAFFLMTKATLFFIKSLGFIVTKPY